LTGEREACRAGDWAAGANCETGAGTEQPRRGRGACKGLLLLLLVKDRRMADGQPYDDGRCETTVDDWSRAQARATSFCGTKHRWMDRCSACPCRRDIRASEIVASDGGRRLRGRPILQFSAGSPLRLPGPASTCRKQRLAVKCVIGSCIHVPLSARSLSHVAWMQAR
jgi:hypothetical protein